MNNPNNGDNVSSKRNTMKNPGQQQTGGQSMPGDANSQQQGGILKHAGQGQGSSPNPDPRNNAGQKQTDWSAGDRKQAQPGQHGAGPANKPSDDTIEQKGADKTADKGEGDQ